MQSFHILLFGLGALFLETVDSSRKRKGKKKSKNNKKILITKKGKRTKLFLVGSNCVCVFDRIKNKKRWHVVLKKKIKQKKKSFNMVRKIEKKSIYKKLKQNSVRKHFGR